MFQSKHAFTCYLDLLQNSWGRYHQHPFSETRSEIRNNSGKEDIGKCFVLHGRQTHKNSQVLGYYDNNSPSLSRKRPRMSCLRQVYYVFGLENLNCPKALVQLAKALYTITKNSEQKFLSCMAFELLGKTTTSFTELLFILSIMTVISSCFLTALKEHEKKKPCILILYCTRF